MITTAYVNNCKDCSHNKGRVRGNKMNCDHPDKDYLGYVVMNFKTCPFLHNPDKIIPADKPLDILNINPIREELEEIILNDRPGHCRLCYLFRKKDWTCLKTYTKVSPDKIPCKYGKKL